MTPTPAPDEPEYLKVEEVAARLKLKEKTIRDWILRGELPAYKLGKEWRIRRDHFDEAMEARLVTGEPHRTGGLWDPTTPRSTARSPNFNVAGADDHAAFVGHLRDVSAAERWDHEWDPELACDGLQGHASLSRAFAPKREDPRACRDLHALTGFSPRAADEARTRDPQLGKLMLYQLSYRRLRREA